MFYLIFLSTSNDIEEEVDITPVNTGQALKHDNLSWKKTTKNKLNALKTRHFFLSKLLEMNLETSKLITILNCLCFCSDNCMVEVKFQIT